MITPVAVPIAPVAVPVIAAVVPLGVLIGRPLGVVLDVGERVKGGDRPALHDPESVVDQAPFDVLRAAEVRFDPAAEPHEAHGLLIRQRGPLPLACVDRHFPCAHAAGRA